ncbi:MAG TPA: carboxypeptidase regulatory-like domain-containing protein [Vicinamibacterales bacterium]|nr:carboxypeptidase regulatory-like domain-containing protein [Vicinamibacterales bacterium]
MTARGLLGATVLVAAGVLGLAGPQRPLAEQGSGSATPALTGTVASAAESRMEGVLVSARQQGSTRTVTVVSSAEGVYSFPRAKLEPGRYDVSIRAAGYVLPSPSSIMHAEVVEGAPARLDLNLRPANVLERALQMTDPEWLVSYPLDDKAKFDLFRDCNRCHSLQRPSMSTYNKDQLAWVMKRMVYSAGSTPMTFQLPGEQTTTWGRAEWGEPSPLQKRQADAIASINLHDGTWDYELKTLPRPKGKETQVIYTTWALPVTSRPHDTRIAADGSIWFNHFNDNAIGRLDPRTGETKQWRWPYRAEQGSFEPTGARTLMGPDHKGRWYIGNQAQDGLVVFDPKTETFTYPDVPGGGEMMDVSASRVDGHGWRAGPDAYRIDLETWAVTTIKGSKPLGRYDIAADTKNNLYGAGRGSTYVWRADARTGEVRYYDIPAKPRGVGGFGGGMRRGISDAQDRLWWGGYDGNFVGMLDPKQPAGKEITLYEVPFPWFFPYDAHYDEQGYTWTGGTNADRVARLNLASGEWNFYLLPFEANIRDINLQPAAPGGLSGLWVGHAHEGLITLIEPTAR